MSPYVRKTAANAIPKLYKYSYVHILCTVFNNIEIFFSMDADQKEPLVEVIEKLLKDQTTVRNHTCAILIHV